jgi:aminocarboxymuconate-semialdehyde decarboxylase
MIIDAHTHGIHGGYLDRIADIGGEWTRKLILHMKEQHKGCPQFFDVALRLEQLKRHGIDIQVVTPWVRMDMHLFPGDAKARLAYARTMNDNMAKLMEDSKGMLLGIAMVPLLQFEEGGRQEMERAIRTLGLKGIAVPSHAEGRPLDSPEFEAVWVSATEMDVPVYIHPQDAASNAGRPYETQFDLSHNFGWPFETALMLSRLVFSGVMERYPTLKIISHHLGGGMIPFFWGRILETYAPEKQQRLIGRVLPKPLLDYFSLFYYDTAVGGNSSAIRCAYDVFGADHIIFATDAPYGPKGGEGRLQTYPGAVTSLGFSEAENEKILSGNARKIFNMK